ncbi:acyltransferase family protein [Pseudescherichia sp.]|uniref:acyltransferase family protein n=1 Tax=Pseudescherichia sp. TaxID=2055881 RepID=UPI002897D8D9|nr:acyltransferase family protein [Pseudescherichia sp.]
MMIKYRRDIDGLRAVAVLSVLVFHFFPSLLPGGFVGVDIFFVISGYLITSIIIKDVKAGSFTISGFYKKRVMRIFPALLLVLSTCYVFGWFLFLQGDYSSLGKHIFGGAFFISNLMLWSESGYFDSSSQLKPLLHLWSLGVEEQFYLFWPLLLMAFAKTKRSLYVTSASVLMISFVAGVYTMHSTSGSNYYSPLSRFWELMFGALLAGYKSNHKASFSQKQENIISFCGLVLLAVSIALINESMAFPGYIAVIPVAGATLLILSENGVVNKVLSLKPLVYIGIISYPLYLWHWPVYSSARIIGAGEPSDTVKCWLMAFCFVLAIFTYKCIESPVRFGAKKPAMLRSLVAGVFSLGLVGIFTFNSDGIPGRAINGSIGEYSSITEPYKFFDFPGEVRNMVCHSVDPDTSVKNGCISTNSDQVFIWGDSYAATFYSGLKSVLKTNGYKAKISQATDGNGPPFFVSGRFTDSGKDLLVANEQKLKFVSEVKPKVILISWMTHGGNASNDMEWTASKLSETINKIKTVSPESRIVIIGPVPEWQDSLLRQVIKFYQDNKAMPPEHMSAGLVQDIFHFDEYLKPRVKAMGADYISAVSSMCNKEGCLVRTAPGASNLTAIDWGHLTKAGARYLIEYNKEEIFKGLK